MEHPRLERRIAGNPYTVWCPKCGAEPREYCHGSDTYRDFGRVVHEERWVAWEQKEVKAMPNPNFTGFISLSVKTVGLLTAYLDSHAPDHGYVVDKMGWEETILFLLDHVADLNEHFPEKSDLSTP